MQLYQASSTRSFGPNSQALPIHAKTGREWGTRKRLLVYGPQDDEFLVVGKIDFKLIQYQTLKKIPRLTK